MENSEKLYFLRGNSQETSGFLYNGEIIVEGVTCPVNVDSLALDVKDVMKSVLKDGDKVLKIKILFNDSFKESDKVKLAVTTLKGEKYYAACNGFIARPQGSESILISIDYPFKTWVTKH